MTKRLFRFWAVVAFVLLIVSPIKAQNDEPKTRTISIWIDADVWSAQVLLKHLNSNGKLSAVQFRQVDPKEVFQYKIAYENSIKPTETWMGTANTHASSVTCYANNGEALFSFTRESRSTENGAANAASEEIIKRILYLEKHGYHP